MISQIHAIQDAADHLINARLFNSDYNAHRILAEFQRDEGIKFTTEQIGEVVFIAEQIWNGHREDAGVTKPVSDQERKEITAMMERAE